MDLPRETEDNIAAVVGLGNPGKQYENTRHNAGFLVVDRLIRDSGVSLQERKFKASWGAGQIAGRKILFVKPLTFMNRSGDAVGEILRYFGLPVGGMLVVHDDLDLPPGRLRLVRGGGPGGHRGVSSIIAHLGTRDFARLKLGIGKPAVKEQVEAFVLQPPCVDEAAIFEDMIGRGAEAVRSVLAVGLSAAMNCVNRKESPAETGSDSGC